MRWLETLNYLPEVTSPEWVIFTDFDETYLAHAGTAEQRRDLAALEDLLTMLAKEKRVLFGWVTGSTIESVDAKAKAHGLRTVPHFIGSAIGSELDLFTRGRGRHADPEWERRIEESGFSKARVAGLIEALEEQDVLLRRQKQIGARSESYYYFRRGEPVDAESVALIREHSKLHGIGVNVSPCNPLVGDPADAFDVDFVPIVCGKKKLVEHMLARHGLDPTRAFAFGDNVGDLEMLEAAANGYLVGNATSEARRRFPRMTSRDYARGILDALHVDLIGLPIFEPVPPHIYPDIGDGMHALGVEQSGDGYARYYRESERAVIARMRRHALPFAHGGSLLDFGCGPGRLLSPFAPEFSRVLLVEPDPERLATARREVERLGLGQKARLVCGGAGALEESERFDVILCSHVIQHVVSEEEPRILRRLARALRPGGVLLLTTCHAPWDEERFFKIFDCGGEVTEVSVRREEFDVFARKPVRGLLPTRWFSKKQLAKELGELGLEVLEYRVYHVTEECFAKHGGRPDVDDVINGAPELQGAEGIDMMLIARAASSK